MSAHTMPSDSKNGRDGDMPLSAFGGGIADDSGHAGDYDYGAAIERGQKPWRDREVLVYLRIEEGRSYRDIAEEAFDGAISGEGVRQAATRMDIDAERDPEDLTPRELALRQAEKNADERADDSYAKYTLRGNGR